MGRRRRVLAINSTADPCGSSCCRFSAHSLPMTECITSCIALLGMRDRMSMYCFVKGDTWYSVNHASMATRSYEFPCVSRTGSNMISRVKGQKKLRGTSGLLGVSLFMLIYCKRNRCGTVDVSSSMFSGMMQFSSEALLENELLLREQGNEWLVDASYEEPLFF